MTSELRPTFIVLADIGGYTRFIKTHGMALLHAEMAITELMESVISASRHPLTLNKLEGDAALFHAPGEGTQAAQDVARQVMAFFPAFAAKLAELNACNVCQCPACLGFLQLKIKVVVHAGDVVHKRVATFEELAGEPVIVAHRLMKNSVRHDQYVLATRAFDLLAAGALGPGGEPGVETCEGIGPVPVVVYPAPGAQTVPAPRVTLAKRAAQLWRYDAYWIARLFGKPKPYRFASLDGL